ncbi:MAG: hypothetical protein HRU24_10750 [Gammaproteobacteria bacterium]|nr:hypothetical protein [Gammaproteobacteria bacterium]
MKYNLIGLAISILWLAGCQASSTGSETKELAEIKSVTVKKPPSRCGMSPPVLNRDKITAMLIKSGKIAVTATPQEQSQQVQQFINNKRKAFSKKCRG